MASFAQTASFKINPTFSACVTLMTSLGAFDKSGLSTPSSHVIDAYTGNAILLTERSEFREGHCEH
ncbi:hypothetical protein BCY88_37280 [Paraburkholderia fungorum]|uniref:Uncharacterized protein n=1 Tax=Paraburkholderia fungorum TaxID=134537 RepID=A0A420FSP2_9BURK|nr:hypothetical protein BCY88_37280 [Paraburkholderia fungorum]